MPALRNTSGDALSLATERYIVRDRQRVVDAVVAAFEPAGDDGFHWYDASLTLLGAFELSGNALLIHVNSHERLAAAKARVEKLIRRTAAHLRSYRPS